MRYENLPRFCAKCSKFGHEVMDYPKLGETHQNVRRKESGVLDLLNHKRALNSDINKSKATARDIEEPKCSNLPGLLSASKLVLPM